MLNRWRVLGGSMVLAALVGAGAFAQAAFSVAPRQDFSCEVWSRPNIRHTTFASLGSMVRAWTPNGSLSLPWVAPRAGYITGISACASREISPGEGQYAIRVIKNNVPTRLDLYLTGRESAGAITLTDDQCIPFSAGDQIRLVDGANGRVNAASVQAQWFGCWAVD